MKLFITKFKMHRDLTISIPTSIKKSNGWGKSTIMEAFLWVMNQKDQFGKEFTPSNVYSNTDAEIERYAEVTFIAVSGQVFTKKAEPVYSRITGTDQVLLKTELSSSYFVDSEKVKKSEYDDAISQLTQGFELSLFTNPMHFFSLDQKKKMEIVAKITNLDLRDYISELPNKAVVKESIARNKKQIKTLKDEISSMDRTFTLPTPVDNRSKIEALREKIKTLQDQEKVSINHEIEKKNATLKIEIERLKGGGLSFPELPTFSPKPFLLAKSLLQSVESEELINKNREYRAVKEEISRLEGIIEFNTNTLADIDQSISDISDSQVFHCSVCSHCDKENCEFIKKDQTRDKMINSFVERMNKVTSEREMANNRLDEEKKRLERIIREGKEIKEKQSKLEAEINEKNKEIIEFNNSINEKNELIEFENQKEKTAHEKKIAAEVVKREKAQAKFNADRQKKIEELQSQIVSSYEKINNTDKIALVFEELEPFENEQIEYDQKLYAYKKSQKKIEENRSEIEAVQEQLIEHEKDLYKIEEAENMYRTDCEKKVNVLLPKGVELQLFRKLIGSDDTEDVAILLIDGFTNPNTSRANSRLAELCQNFQKHFSVTFPIFFDNAENCEPHNMPFLDNLVELRVKSE